MSKVPEYIALVFANGSRILEDYVALVALVEITDIVNEDGPHILRMQLRPSSQQVTNRSTSIVTNLRVPTDTFPKFISIVE